MAPRAVRKVCGPSLRKKLLLDSRESEYCFFADFDDMDKGVGFLACVCSS